MMAERRLNNTCAGTGCGRQATHYLRYAIPTFETGDNAVIGINSLAWCAYHAFAETVTEGVVTRDVKNAALTVAFGRHGLTPDFVRATVTAEPFDDEYWAFLTSTEGGGRA